jgi:hypothetical protein
VSVGKFEILAAFTYAKALRNGWSEPEAKERGIVAAVAAVRARSGARGGPRASGDSTPAKEASRKKSKPLTAGNYDQQIVRKLGAFYDGGFMPRMRQLVEARLTYARLKEVLQIPPDVGAKITSSEFERRAEAFLKQANSPEDKSSAGAAPR